MPLVPTPKQCDPSVKKAIQILTQKLGLKSVPTFAGLNITGNSVFGLNSSVFQPTTDSTTFFQVLDADGGNPVLNVDTTNERIGAGTNAPQRILHLKGENPFIRLENTIGGGQTMEFFAGTLGIGVGTPTTPQQFIVSAAAPTTALQLVSSGMIMKGILFPLAGNDLTFRSDGSGAAGRKILWQSFSASPFAWQTLISSENIAAGMIPLILTENAGLLGIGGETVPETAIELTHATPYITLHNSTHEDSDGGRESRLNFKGEQSGGEETTLARIEVGHDGSADDEKGYIDGYTNIGSDGNSPTKCFRFDANGTFSTLFGRILKTNRLTGNTTLDATHHQVFADTDGGAFTVTLPAGVAGTEYRIVNTGSSENNLTIAPDGAELLIGVNANWTLMDGEALMIVYEATEGWF